MTLGETLPAREEEDYGSRMDREWLRRLTHPDSKILNRRESLVVRLRFGVFSDQEHISLGQEHGVDTREGLTLQQVGKILRVTRERVRQIEGKALQKLQNVLKRRGDLSES
jgi:RNA polymerase sigma factor (sigma-70 family)